MVKFGMHSLKYLIDFFFFQVFKKTKTMTNIGVMKPHMEDLYISKYRHIHPCCMITGDVSNKIIYIKHLF